MSRIVLRTGPDYQFIPKDQQKDFEKSIIDLYCDSNGGFWGTIPSFDANIFASIKPSFILAGIWAEASGDPSYFTKQTEGKLIPEIKEIWSDANLRKIAEEYPEAVNEAMVWAGQDALQVLDFHNMFYAMAVGISHEGTQQGFTKFPVVSVW